MAKKKKIKRQKPFISTPDNPKSKTIIARPRVIAVCKAYNIADDTLLDFLMSKGYRNLNPNSLLDTDALKLIDQTFQSDKIAKDRVRGKTTIEFINPKTSSGTNVPSNTQVENAEIKLYREPVLHLTHDIFNQQKQNIILKGYPVLSSNFSDTEAMNICSKMSSSFTRNLCKQLHNPKANRQLIIYQLHHIANKAYKIFGSKILTFIYNLRNLNFKNKTASEIKTYTKVVPDFPIISFDTGSASFKISFFVKQTKKNDKLKADIRLFAPKTYEQIGFIDEEGYVMTRLEKFRPQLTLFYQASKNNSFKIFSGVETGNCDICGRELSHPVSLRIGIGPVCASNNQIDRTLYDFR